MEEQRIREISLSDCPIGNVFDVRDRDIHIETTYFAGWEDGFWNPDAPRNTQCLWRVMIDDDGKKSLEYPMKGEALLTTGDIEWRDYTVSASVRQMHSWSCGTPDDEYQTVARNGIMLRYRDKRQYYFFCLEGLNRVVLYHRLDDQYTVLGEKSMLLDRRRYYVMRISCQDSMIRCELDGQVLFEVRDNRISKGKAGLRTNCLARYRDVRVEYPEDTYGAFLQTRDKEQRELDALREKYPKPVLWRSLKLPEAEMVPRFGCLRNSEKTDLLLLTPVPCNGIALWGKMVAMDLNGEIFWEIAPKDSRLNSNYHTGIRLVDINGDGVDEIITAFDGKIKILSGSDGATLCEAPLPKGGVYGAQRGKQMKIDGIYPVQWTPPPSPKGFMLTEEYGGNGGNCIIALDSNLKAMWYYYGLPVNYGHDLDMWDIDGDGREEVAAGYHLVDADGKCIWQVEGSAYFDVQQGARHPDIVAIADFNGDGKVEFAYACGGEGFMLVEGKTGKILVRHKIGHAQSLKAGNFRPDLPGIEIICSTLHGNPGIVCLFDGNGRFLNRFEPDHISYAGSIVNWSGDGQELFFLTSSLQSFGLWDAWGRKVVDRWIPETEINQFSVYVKVGQSVRDLVGDPRDEMILMLPNMLRIYTQDQPFLGNRIFKPNRRSAVRPYISYPNWMER